MAESSVLTKNKDENLQIGPLRAARGQNILIQIKRQFLSPTQAVWIVGELYPLTLKQSIFSCLTSNILNRKDFSNLEERRANLN